MCAVLPVGRLATKSRARPAQGRTLADKSLHAALVASGWFSLGLVLLNISLALVPAVLLNRRLPGTTSFRVAFFSPVVVSIAAWTIVWGFLLQVDGGIGSSLAAVGIGGPNWLRGNVTAMVAVVVVQMFKNVGLNMILFLFAVQSVREEIQKAATLGGAGPWRWFWPITIP